MKLRPASRPPNLIAKAMADAAKAVLLQALKVNHYVLADAAFCLGVDRGNLSRYLSTYAPTEYAALREQGLIRGRGRPTLRGGAPKKEGLAPCPKIP